MTERILNARNPRLTRQNPGGCKISETWTILNVPNPLVTTLNLCDKSCAMKWQSPKSRNLTKTSKIQAVLCQKAKAMIPGDQNFETTPSYPIE